jgi:hypothetical protein
MGGIRLSTLPAQPNGCLGNVQKAIPGMQLEIRELESGAADAQSVQTKKSFQGSMISQRIFRISQNKQMAGIPLF